MHASSFSATELSITDDDGVLVVALGAPTGEADFSYLMLQRARTPAAGDVALGRVGPYIEWCSRRWSWYSQIERLELSPDRIRVAMSEAAADRMGTDGVLETRFELDAPQHAQLQAALARILEPSTFAVLP